MLTMIGSLQYYLKAQFGYSKDEFANLLLIAGAAGMLSQVPTQSQQKNSIVGNWRLEF